MFEKYGWALPAIVGLLVAAGILMVAAIRRRVAAATGQLKSWRDWDYASEFERGPTVNLVLNLVPRTHHSPRLRMETADMLTIDPVVRVEFWTASGRTMYIDMPFAGSGEVGTDDYKVRVGTMLLLYRWVHSIAPGQLPLDTQWLVNGEKPEWMHYRVEGLRLGLKSADEIGRDIRPGQYDPATFG